MSGPLQLGRPQSRLDQDRKLVQPAWHRRMEAEIVKEREKALAHCWAAQHHVVRSAYANARNLHDLLRELALLVVQLFHLELRKASLAVGRAHLGPRDQQRPYRTNHRDS